MDIRRYLAESGKDVFGEWLSELRIDWGPGYRVYYAMAGKQCVLLLCGGDKRKQRTISRARGNISRITRKGLDETQSEYFSRQSNRSRTARQSGFRG
jgi:hypothetical protein